MAKRRRRKELRVKIDPPVFILSLIFIAVIGYAVYQTQVGGQSIDDIFFAAGITGFTETKFARPQFGYVQCQASGIPTTSPTIGYNAVEDGRQISIDCPIQSTGCNVELISEEISGFVTHNRLVQMDIRDKNNPSDIKDTTYFLIRAGGFEEEVIGMFDDGTGFSVDRPISRSEYVDLRYWECNERFTEALQGRTCEALFQTDKSQLASHLDTIDAQAVDGLSYRLRYQPVQLFMFDPNAGPSTVDTFGCDISAFGSNNQWEYVFDSASEYAKGDFTGTPVVETSDCTLDLCRIGGVAGFVSDWQTTEVTNSLVSIGTEKFFCVNSLSVQPDGSSSLAQLHELGKMDVFDFRTGQPASYIYPSGFERAVECCPGDVIGDDRKCVQDENGEPVLVVSTEGADCITDLECPGGGGTYFQNPADPGEQCLWGCGSSGSCEPSNCRQIACQSDLDCSVPGQSCSRATGNCEWNTLVGPAPCDYDGTCDSGETVDGCYADCRPRDSGLSNQELALIAGGLGLSSLLGYLVFIRGKRPLEVA